MANNTTNVLASGIEIIGSIRFQNDMTIDGKVDGEIQSETACYECTSFKRGTTES